MAQKVGEEGLEVALAAVAEPDDKVVAESADLLYHLLVLWRAKGLPLDELLSELDRRFGRKPREGSANPPDRRSSEIG